MAGLDVTAITGQWVSTAFLLTMAVVIPVTGFLIQRLHTRTLFIAAMSLFVTGTVVAALAPTFVVLLVARIVQACGTAIMLPLLMTTLMTLVAPDERGKMMGNVSTVISVAPAAGPMVAGVLLNLVGWRGIFWFMLPIGIAMLVFGGRTIVNVTEPKKVPIDVVSVILSAVGFGGLVYGLSRAGAGAEGAAAGQNTTIMVGCLGIGALSVTLFVLRQVRLQRRDAALLDMRTFGYRQFAVGLAIMASLMGALFGVIIVLPIYLQSVLDLAPLTVGLLLLPGGLLMGLFAQVVGRLYDRVGPRVLVVPGAALTTMVMFGFSRLSEQTSPWWVLAGHVLLSLGLAFVFTPMFTSSLGAVPPRLYSHASAMLGTLQQVAGAAGVALFVTIMSARITALTRDGVPGPQAGAGGVQAAFLAGALLSLVPLALAFLVRRPPAEAADLHGPGAHDAPSVPSGESTPVVELPERA